ncbi:DEAD/DEAH box helicase family protein, partial [Pseudomonas aeruginosa]
MSRSLRSWQNSCITKALEHLTVTQHFFCQATPGAGKTRMAAELTSRLLQQDRIDLVLCFAPSCQVVEGFRSTFSEVLGRRLDGQMGAVGAAYTYQAMEYRDEGFWQLLDGKRLANTPPRFFQLAAWCPPVFGGHHFKPLAEDLP